ncbi:hypothetical protein NIES267_37730 [Calothrix parasitica NIES-267]|uniref:Uncharacterized protein n=1 Tax=Calothrix parasitica NIES-267 TaxID=1973488 RepID=A0A1Z4LSS4_9CYAN|nr:hypothetical protein NIES267_37730 [Calothrix parasitica NIES-267]
MYKPIILLRLHKNLLVVQISGNIFTVDNLSYQYSDNYMQIIIIKRYCLNYYANNKLSSC